MAKKPIWTIVNGIIEVASLALTVAGIFTGVKAAGEEEELTYAKMEQRYGLTPVNEDESD